MYPYEYWIGMVILNAKINYQISSYFHFKIGKTLMKHGHPLSISLTLNLSKFSKIFILLKHKVTTVWISNSGSHDHRLELIIFLQFRYTFFKIPFFSMKLYFKICNVHLKYLINFYKRIFLFKVYTFYLKN